MLISILVYLDEGNFLWVVFTAALLHEMGHYIPLRLLGGRVSCLELTGGGVGMEWDAPLAMGYGKELLVVLGGPFVSIVSALLFSIKDGIMVEQTALAGMCLSHGVFNLLPMRGLDGGRVLELILDTLGCPRTSAVLRAATWITSAALGVVCGVFALRYRNVSLLIALVYVLTSLRPDNKKALPPLRQ